MADEKTDNISKDDLRNIMYSYTSESSKVEEENKMLKQTINRLKMEVDRYRAPSLMVCEVSEVLKEKAIIRLPNGNMFYVDVSSEVENLKPGDSVLCEQKNLSIIKKVEATKKYNVEKFVIVEKPKIKWNDVGGLKREINEVKEVVELPLKKPELFKKMGIKPPKGILLHGPPGTGKTLLAKAVAASTNSTFIEMVGSELVQKFIGEGAKLVKEMFKLARAKAPAIIFIDEIDALASRRIEVGTSGEREVQRTFMQFLAEFDGFNNLDNVKVIGCTNRKDILDPAILRPGRLDRQIKVDIPDDEGKKEIFKIHTKEMKLAKGFDIDKVIKNMEDFSGAEIKPTCTEAGYFAIRKNRQSVTQKDVLNAIEKVKAEEEYDDAYLNMFG